METRKCIFCGASVTRSYFSRTPERTTCSTRCAGKFPKPHKYGSEEESFWAKVDKSGECWIWTAGKNRDTRHGLFKSNGKTVQAHRYAYELQCGPIPAGMQLNHACNNPACVRVGPGHIYVGTQLENMRDMLMAGRHGRRGHHELKPYQVLEIVKRYRAGERATGLSAEFGVTKNAIYNIITGRTWANLTAQEPQP